MALYDIYTQHTAKKLFPTRAEILASLKKSELFDLVVVGGGLFGTTLAHLAAFNGLKTILLEKGDLGANQPLTESLLDKPSFFGGRKELYQAEELQETASHIIKPTSYIEKLGFLKNFFNRLSGRVIGVKDGGSEILQYQYSPLALTLERALAASQEGATVINYAKVNAILIQTHTVRQISWSDELTKKNYNIHCKTVAVCGGKNWYSIGSITKVNEPQKTKRDYLWHDEGNVLRLEGGKPLQALQIAEEGLLYVLPKFTKHFTPVQGRKLPGAANYNLNTSEFYKAASDASVPVAVIERCINRLGGRVAQILQIDDGLKIVDDRFLLGEFILAIQQDRALTVSDLLERRLFLSKENCTPNICKIAAECLENEDVLKTI